jgi:hypothetical protein
MSGPRVTAPAAAMASTSPRRPRGLWLVGGGLASLALTCAPLLLYIAFGPADGNPIGLGLLAMLGVPLSCGLLAFGAMACVIEHLVARRRRDAH